MNEPCSYKADWEAEHARIEASLGRRASRFADTPCPGQRCRSLAPDSLLWAVPPSKLPASSWSATHGSEHPLVPRRHLYLVLVAVSALLALEFASYLVQAQQWKPAVAEMPVAVGRHLEASGQAAESPCDHAESHKDTEKHHSQAFEPVVFFILAYIASAVAQQIMALMPENFRVPHSVNLFIMGIFMSWMSSFAEGSEFGKTIKQFQQADPHVIFWVLLPAILYEDSSGVNWHVMRKVLPNCLLLALPGVILNALLTGCLIKLFLGAIEWSWDSAFLLGSILSATDPVAVMGALHELNAPDKLALLVSGESLVNDGSAVVIFMLFWESARGLRELTPGYSLGFFVRMALGGPLLGLIVSFLAFQWLKKTRKFNIEILILLVAVFGTFFVAEHPQIKVSGVLAVVVFGFFMASQGQFAINIHEMHRHHAIVSFMALVSNEAIFVLAGVVAYNFGSIKSNPNVFSVRDYAECSLLFVIIHCTRALLLLAFMPLLSRFGYGLRWGEAAICLFGGLRGAVGLAMALMVEHDRRLDFATRSRVAFHTSGIVLATLLINGTFIKPLYKRLNLYPVPPHHRKMLSIALRKADMITRRRASIFEQHWFFHNCYFGDLWTLVPSLSSQMELLERSQAHGFYPRKAVVGKSMKSVASAKSARMSRVASRRATTMAKPEEGGPRTVNRVMVDIALKLGISGLHENPDRRLAEKLRFRRKRTNAQNSLNMFLPATFGKASEESEDKNSDVMTLALHMSKEEFEKAKAYEQLKHEMWSSVIDAARKQSQHQEDKTAFVNTEIAQATSSIKPLASQAQSDDCALQDVSDDSRAPTPLPEPQNYSMLRLPGSPAPLPPTAEPPPRKPKRKSTQKLQLSLDGEAETISLGRRSTSVSFELVRSLPSSQRRNSRQSLRASLHSIDVLNRLSLLSRESELAVGDRTAAAATEAFETNQPMRYETSRAFQVGTLLRHASQVHGNFMEITSKVIRVSKATEALTAIKSMDPRKRQIQFAEDDQEYVKEALAEMERASSKEKHAPVKLRSRLRWQSAKDRVVWALRKIAQAQKERQRLYDQLKEAGKFGRNSTKEHIIRDAASMVEVFQTVLNFQRSMYHRMFEAHSISEHSYQILMSSLEVQEEAINGELRAPPYNPNDEEPNEDLRSLELGTHEEQMSLCFAVAWQTISRALSRRSSAVWHCFKNFCFKSCWVEGSYWLMRQDLEILLAYVMTQDQLVEDLEVLQLFQLEVLRPLRIICEKVKATFMFKLNQQAPAMFAFVEHLICVKLMCGLQHHLIMDMAEEGLLSEEDAHHIITYAITPVQQALEAYSPSRSQLALANHPSFAHGIVRGSDGPMKSLDPSFFRRNKAMLKKARHLNRGPHSDGSFGKDSTLDLGGDSRMQSAWSFGASRPLADANLSLKPNREEAAGQAW